MNVIPAVDVLDGSVVRLMRGAYDEVKTYGDDPVAAVQGWHEAGADLVHVVDLSGARTGESDASLVRRLAGANCRFQIGGGLRTVDDVEAMLAAGAQRVVVGTAAVFEPVVLQAMCAAVGSDAIVAALDVRDGRARGSGWEDDGEDLEVVVARVAAAGVTRALVTGISTDGTMEGPDLEVLRVVGRSAPAMRLIGSGGVGTLADLVQLASLDLEAAIVGRAFYEGRFTYAEATAALS
ncbi:MAG: 1-(5-phosphoribosyl)-5-[(5-phosphoribosylamino)methylideneamino] imidazole-4-carboxamide isomerase [Acidimicrobiia bacterium]|nr:1-(5-phosphoribosyl)-5-[(5-phosphoribosylamino)methylideneamino] imidazole-4-carboxamide isomerase [Acidimicrobiia bacterium]